ncbi:MAG: NAD(P)/FAD-dependent oxidoreductase [Geminicoccaceae bacterium]
MSWDVAIAGGGPAGAIAACRLADAGRRVVLLERDRGPSHKVCGEFWSIEAQGLLDEVTDGAPVLPSLGAAPIEGLRLVCGRRVAVAPLPFQAWGLSRFRLDAWLLRQAERRGAIVERGRAARSLEGDGAGVRVRTEDETLVAGAALLATGKHELRGRPRTAARSDYIGLKLHLRLAEAQDRALDRQVEVVLFEGGYAGLQHVEDGLANLCLLVTRRRFAELGRNWRRLLIWVPHLNLRLDGAVACWPRPLAISGVPFGFMQRNAEMAAVYRVGDQAAVIPSFTGDGMAMALRSGGRAAAAILAGEPPAVFQLRLARTFAPALRLATALARAGAVPTLQGPIVAFSQLLPGLLGYLALRTRAA